MIPAYTNLHKLKFGQRFRLPQFPSAGIFEVIEGLVIEEGEKEARLQIRKPDGTIASTLDVAILNGMSHFVEVIKPGDQS